MNPRHSLTVLSAALLLTSGAALTHEDGARVAGAAASRFASYCSPEVQPLPETGSP